MSNDNKFSDKFKRAAKKVAKGAVIGGGIVFVSAALPIIPVSMPLIAVGAAIGAWMGYNKGK